MDIIAKLREEMSRQSSEENIQTTLRFFKKHEDLKVCGLKSAQVKKISKQFTLKISEYTKDEIFANAEILLSSGVMEESFVACNWLYGIKKHFVKEDFKIFKDWVDMYVSNWATCDTFCSRVTGEFIIQYPEFGEELKEWAQSDNMWVKRAAAVSLVVSLRKNEEQHSVAYEIANLLLLDTEDLVQKGYGWMLKVASKYQEKKVFEYVMKNKQIMPRTSLRYAIEKMPANLRAEAMKK